MLKKSKLEIKAQSKLFEGLNSEQKQAVTHSTGPLLIVAGAGTGKTTVITRRIAYLIEQGLAKPEEILALAFGEKAAAEMEERVDQLLPLGNYDLHISTFHSFGEYILQEHGLEIGLPDFKVLDEVGQWLLVRRNLEKFPLDYYRPLGNPTKFIKALLAHFSRLKDELVTPEEYLEYAEKLKLNKDFGEAGVEIQEQEAKRVEEVANAYHVYQKLLLENSALDFGDLISYSLQLLKKRPRVLEHYRNRFKYILVDEFQDTNFSQYELLKLLAHPQNNLTVVGDDDQSIFKFRGASISNILHFQKDYPKAEFVSLTGNYRSAQNILDAAYGFIQLNNPDRLEVKIKLSKKLRAHEKAEGELTHIQTADYLAEAETVVGKIVEVAKAQKLSWNDFAILARSHSTLEPFLNKLDEVGLPYIYFANKGLYHKSIILDLISYFRLLDNYHDSPALYRVLQLPVYSIATETIVTLSHYARRKSLSLYEALKRSGEFVENAESREGLKKFLSLLEKHAETARTKTCDQLFVEVASDLDFVKRAHTESFEGLQNARFLEGLRRRIQDFQNESPDKSLRVFMSALALEQEGGERGDLEFDPEAGPESVKLMTVHAAKGLEFTHVFVVGMVDKRFPTIERHEQIEVPSELIKDILPEGDVHLEEERRLFYVAMTRAKQGLYLTSAEDYGGKRAKKPSRFLQELGLVAQTAARPTGQVVFQKRTRAPFVIPPPKTFSFSQISLFKKCPLEYKYRYILKLPVPGSGEMSFGLTIHSTLEKFLKYFKQTENAPDLFGGGGSNELPDFKLLEKYYEQSWIDDWYEDRWRKDDYRKAGYKMLKDFYEECQKNRPKPRYLEQGFKLKLGEFVFTGKIDRADETPSGLVIIDYKTGAPRTIADVDKQQLLVYQWAATEGFREKVAELQYWFLKDRLEKSSFLGKDQDILNLQDDFLKIIREMVACAKQDKFYDLDLETSHRKDCAYRDLE